MAKKQTPYGKHPIASRKASGILNADDFSEATTGRRPNAITESPITGAVVLQQKGVYQMYRAAVIAALKANSSSGGTIRNEGNYFHLTANFPDVDSARLALDAIRDITHLHRK